MKANKVTSKDLMVGDFVMLHYDINYKTGEPLYTNVRITSINEDGTINVSMHDGDSWDADLINPIPITKELLEKNGFERENLITSYNHYTGIDNRVSLNDDFYYINSRDVWSVHVDSEDYCTIANCELTYLHELQHLLKLCNIDFEFVV